VISACPWRKHGPWGASAAATSKTATAAKPPHLRQALTIYQRIGARRARQVQETFRHHKLHHRDNLHGGDETSEEA
jgi:hypothetical protein